MSQSLTAKSCSKYSIASPMRWWRRTSWLRICPSVSATGLPLVGDPSTSPSSLRHSACSSWHVVRSAVSSARTPCSACLPRSAAPASHPAARAPCRSSCSSSRDSASAPCRRAAAYSPRSSSASPRSAACCSSRSLTSAAAFVGERGPLARAAGADSLVVGDDRDFGRDLGVVVEVVLPVRTNGPVEGRFALGTRGVPFVFG
mmetsp:Transcript_36134/g.103933  ORF Transcript_36134/g.103933 Transcript_36134/m.103933 type:complete len:202 (+) Transcript_36134:998-1603(+)